MSGKLSKKLQKLDDFLLDLERDDEAMLLSELEGFLAGVVVCPELILPSEWTPMIWGENGPVFDNERQAREILGLIMEHYNDVIRQLDRGDFSPLYDVDIDGEVLWELWIEGFLTAMQMRPQAWVDLSHDDDAEIQRALFVLGRLGELATLSTHECEPIEIDEALEEAAPDLIPIHVEILHRARKAKASANAPARSGLGSKIGRNDPCPCGSGKKFKKLLPELRRREAARRHFAERQN